MTKLLLDTFNFNFNPLYFAEVITDWVRILPSDVMYIELPDGELANRCQLICETLTDGSKVYSIRILS